MCCILLFALPQAVGDVCLSVFVFSTEQQLTISFLKIQWDSGIKESKLRWDPIWHVCLFLYLNFTYWNSFLYHSPVGFTVHWVSKSYVLNQLVPPCRPVKSRGALVPALSPDGLLLAIVLNQKDPRVRSLHFIYSTSFTIAHWNTVKIYLFNIWQVTQVLFISIQNFVTVSSLLGGCGLKTLNVPAKYVR